MQNTHKSEGTFNYQIYLLSTSQGPDVKALKSERLLKRKLKFCMRNTERETTKYQLNSSRTKLRKTVKKKMRLIFANRAWRKNDWNELKPDGLIYFGFSLNA